MQSRVTATDIWILSTIVLIGLTLRLFSLSWNDFPHADVQGDVATTTLFLATDGLWETAPDPSAPRQPSLFTGDSRLGIPSLQHGPIWQLLGAAVSSLWQGAAKEDVFLALRILSLLCGMAVIVLLWKIARTLIDERSALACALWASVSYLLIDYSGNGAFYAFQALLYLLWILIALRPPSWKRSAAFGAVTGFTYLVNYQAIILLPASIILEFIQDKYRWRCLLNIALVTVMAGLFASPWLMRNAILVGDPFAHHLVNSTYVFSKSGIHATLTGFVYRYEPEGIDRLTTILDMIFTSWLPNNSFYIARKLFILAPVAFIFMSYGLIDQMLSPERRRRLLPVLILFAAHFLISASWPITKFRYFVPLLPLVLLLSAESIAYFVRDPQYWKLTVTFITGAFVLGSALTYLSVPTHTYYYDGAITTDPFSGRQEWNYLRDHHLLPQAR